MIFLNVQPLTDQSHLLLGELCPKDVCLSAPVWTGCLLSLAYKCCPGISFCLSSLSIALFPGSTLSSLVYSLILLKHILQ